MGDVRISAKSTLIALNRSIEVISANLTGANVYGYKGTRLSFADTLVNVLRAGTGASGGQGGLNPIQVSTGGISVGATTTDFSQGSIVQTKNTGDVAIQGNAFFQAVDAAGRITYESADEIIVLEAGRVIERGTHADLLAKGGKYADMWERQAKSAEIALAAE